MFDNFTNSNPIPGVERSGLWLGETALYVYRQGGDYLVN